MMNEKLKELTKQSGLIQYDSDSKLLAAQKFAELIVQECVNVLHDNELWSRDISHVLKEHFGAE